MYRFGISRNGTCSRSNAVLTGGPFSVYTCVKVVWWRESELGLPIEHMTEPDHRALGDGNLLEIVFGMGLPYQSLLHRMRRSDPLRVGKASTT